MTIRLSLSAHKALTVLLFCLVIIPGEKLAFPLGVLMLMEMSWSVFLGIVCPATCVYLLLDAVFGGVTRMRNIINLVILGFLQVTAIALFFNTVRYAGIAEWVSFLLFLVVARYCVRRIWKLL